MSGHVETPSLRLVVHNEQMNVGEEVEVDGEGKEEKVLSEERKQQY